MDLTLHNHTYKDVQLHWAKYANGRPALQLFTKHGEPLMKATVNMPDITFPDPSLVFIKDYSENEGILDFLIEHEIVVPMGISVPTGFVTLPVCKIHPKQLGALK